MCSLFDVASVGGRPGAAGGAGPPARGRSLGAAAVRGGGVCALPPRTPAAHARPRRARLHVLLNIYGSVAPPLPAEGNRGRAGQRRTCCPLRTAAPRPDPAEAAPSRPVPSRPIPSRPVLSLPAVPSLRSAPLPGASGPPQLAALPKPSARVSASRSHRSGLGPWEGRKGCHRHPSVPLHLAEPRDTVWSITFYC